jgi:hypothetical protein
MAKLEKLLADWSARGISNPLPAWDLVGNKKSGEK